MQVIEGIRASAQKNEGLVSGCGALGLAMDWLTFIAFSQYVSWGASQQKRLPFCAPAVFTDVVRADIEGPSVRVNVASVNSALADRGSISEAEIAKLMARYEATHPVEDYWALGWQVWPIFEDGACGRYPNSA